MIQYVQDTVFTLQENPIDFDRTDFVFFNCQKIKSINFVSTLYILVLLYDSNSREKNIKNASPTKIIDKP